MIRFAADGRFDRRKPGFDYSRKAEAAYARDLRRVARVIGDIVRGFAPDGDLPTDQEQPLAEALRRYSETLGGWAQAVGMRMLADVDRRDSKQWMAHSERIGRALKHEVYQAPVGAALQQRLAEQVTLIRSLPLDAAERVHQLTLKGLVEGRRASEIADELMKTGQVTASRATLIARTETSRTASLLTQVRAQSIGSTAYVWKTSRDASVRPSHRKLQGKVFNWNDPPTVDGMVGHAGCFPNCRCYSSPILPD